MAGNTPVLVHNCGGKAPLTFRGERRGPDEIFKNGIQSWGDDMNLLTHATGETIDARTSGYVSTSYSREIAGEFDSSYIYTIRAHGGVDVNIALGADSPYPEEAELAFPREIKPECMSGCILPGGDWVPNPGFRR
jgi:Scabin-like